MYPQQFAVELRQRPAQARCGGGGGGDLGGARPGAPQHRLGQGQDEQQLGLGHRRRADGGLTRGLVNTVDAGEPVLADRDEINLIGRGPRREREDNAQ